MQNSHQHFSHSVHWPGELWLCCISLAYSNLLKVIHSHIKLCSQTQQSRCFLKICRNKSIFTALVAVGFAAHQLCSLGDQRLCLAMTSALGCNQALSFPNWFYSLCSFIRENFEYLFYWYLLYPQCLFQWLILALLILKNPTYLSKPLETNQSV